MPLDSMTNAELKSFVESHRGYLTGVVSKLSENPIRSELLHKYKACMRYDLRLEREKASRLSVAV